LSDALFFTRVLSKISNGASKYVKAFLKWSDFSTFCSEKEFSRENWVAVR
jgi:hypothetical protein